MREGRRARRERVFLFEMLSTSRAELIWYFVLSIERLITARRDYRFVFDYSAFYFILSEQNVNTKTL